MGTSVLSGGLYGQAPLRKPAGYPKMRSQTATDKNIQGIRVALTKAWLK